MSPALITRLLLAHERWVRWVYTPVFSLLCALYARWVTRHGLRDLRALAKLGRHATRPASCCPEGSADQLLLKRFVDNLRSMRDPRTLRALLEPERIAGTRRWLAALLRVELAQECRHAVLGWIRKRTGSPAVILSDAQIAVAPDCELSCTGCYALPGHGGAEPTVASILHAVDESATLGATAIHLIGKGEPLAPRARGLAVARAIAARPHILFTVATSGVGVDDEVIAALRAAANVFVWVSVDGPPDAHEARRGEGTVETVRALMARLRAHGIPFGFSTMASRASIPLIADPELVSALAAEGCLMGAYVRYFPLAGGRVPELLLRPGDVAAWRVSLEKLREVSPIPLVDLDELEEESGCRSRLGRTLYIDAVRGDVTPCIRVPFPPEGAQKLGEASLDSIVRHPFFAGYRARAGERCLSCGVDLERELGDVEADLAGAGCAAPPALSRYRARAGSPAGRRMLPVVNVPEHAHEDLPELQAGE